MLYVLESDMYSTVIRFSVVYNAIRLSLLIIFKSSFLVIFLAYSSYYRENFVKIFNYDYEIFCFTFQFFALYLWPYYQVYTNLKLLYFPGELTFYHFEAALYIPSKIIFFCLKLFYLI